MFAQIENGIITAIFEGNFRETNEPFLIRDISYLDPQPGPGWRYDGEAYLPPVEPEAPAPVLKTEYTHREFILRLGSMYGPIRKLKDVNAALPPETRDYDLVRLFEIWDKASYLDLNDPGMTQAFAAFVSLGIVTQEDATTFLTPDEELLP